MFPASRKKGRGELFSRKRQTKGCERTHFKQKLELKGEQRRVCISGEKGGEGMFGQV